MKEDELKKLSEDFNRDSQQFVKEFNQLFYKWLKKNPRLSCLMALSLPLSLLNSMARKIGNLSEVMPELPDVMNRYLSPFNKIRDLWGKIPDKEFFDKYSEAYESQFTPWCANDDERSKFKEWYEANKK